MADVAKVALEYYRRAVVANRNARKVADAAGIAYDAAVSAYHEARKAEAECAAEATAVGVTKEELIAVGYDNPSS